ncbi:hypothetical protein SAY86_023234 [Trapa natans]|uniref:DUF4005 domain-containing protein n=1 Tax=Trapa natans TaxID=22666 RepID=A0AAN7R5L8_TRANT|nr:hypothetical protein SAY86_023234 [Trapa natans]
MENSVWDNGSLDDPALRGCKQEDERSAKILEVDTWMPRFNSQASIRSSPNHSVDHGGMGKIFVPFEPANYSSQPPNPRASLSEEEVASLSLNFPKGKEWKIRSVGNSSIVYCAGSSSRPGSRRGSFTPTRSECSWGYISSYSGHPNYMSNTESSRAKARSQSAPRQRLRTDRYGCSMNKAALRGSWDSRSMKDSVWSYNMTDYSRKTAEDQVSN